MSAVPPLRSATILHPAHLPALAKDAVVAWFDDRAPTMGAALAYYTLFSIAPLLLIVIAVAGMVLIALGVALARAPRGTGERKGTRPGA